MRRRATRDRLESMLRSNEMLGVEGGLVFQVFGDADKEVNVAIAYDGGNPNAPYAMIIDYYGNTTEVAIKAEEFYQSLNEQEIQAATTAQFNELKSQQEETDNTSDELLWEEAFNMVVEPFESFAVKTTNIDAAEMFEEHIPDDVDIDTTMLPADIVWQ